MKNCLLFTHHPSCIVHLGGAGSFWPTCMWGLVTDTFEMDHWVDLYDPYRFTSHLACNSDIILNPASDRCPLNWRGYYCPDCAPDNASHYYEINISRSKILKTRPGYFCPSIFNSVTSFFFWVSFEAQLHPWPTCCWHPQVKLSCGGFQ